MAKESFLCHVIYGEPVMATRFAPDSLVEDSWPGKILTPISGMSLDAGSRCKIAEDYAVGAIATTKSLVPRPQLRSFATHARIESGTAERLSP